ncbi:metallophosphoesterase family protein [Neobacillus niacini]|uniref:metallophosphoesterase family protein n=1 Tax=Neobacillus niacini TaxID=86668 RepID=UPI0005F04AE8|nr:metallophosphoesterase family protein [Neobacillus niacini]
MKICLFSDIHGNLYALEKFLIKSRELGIDFYVFCGDIFGYYYDQDTIISKLKGMEHLSAIKGNHDQYFLNASMSQAEEKCLIDKFGYSYKDITIKISNENKEFVKNLSEQIELNFFGKRIGIFHGSPMDPLNGRVYPDTEISESDGYLKYDYVILGHTHYRMVRHIGSTTVINPGSLGQPRDKHGFSFAVLTIPEGEIEYHEIEWDRNLLVKDIEINDPGSQKLINILFRNEESP